MPEHHYLINEVNVFPERGNYVEGAVFTDRKLTAKEEKDMYEMAYKAVAEWNYVHYNLKIKNVDKAKFITYYLKKHNVKGAEYLYLF